VVLNPGCIPSKDKYYDLADLVVVFENDQHTLMNPRLDHAPLEYLSKARAGHGLKLALPEASSTAPASKFGILIHDLQGETQEQKLSELQILVHDLVQMKRVSAVFITDIKSKEMDVYGNWSSIWDEFIRLLAEARDCSSFLY
jgi:hypothetical protein